MEYVENVFEPGTETHASNLSMSFFIPDKQARISRTETHASEEFVQVGPENKGGGGGCK